MALAALVDISFCRTMAGGWPKLVFNREYGGDQRSWAAQIQQLAQHFIVLTYNQRGFAPSVPKDAFSIRPYGLH
jgi:hypothetical protein